MTIKLFKLVQEYPPIEQLVAEALPAMQKVAHQTRQSCHLGIIEGAEVVILAQVNPPTSIGFYIKLGSTVELMEASTGYVILAYQKKAIESVPWLSGSGRQAWNCPPTFPKI